MKKIIVEPPSGEARRERIERQLFQQLAAVRVADRAEAVIPSPKKSRAGWAFAFASVAAAVAVFLLITRGGERGGSLSSPSRVVTPIGGASQINVGDALIDARSDTAYVWERGPDGSVTIRLERGTIECDVEHRPNRPAFRVIAKDITVKVVGTRFTVALHPATEMRSYARVDVARGKVHVEAPGGTWYVEGGEYWTPITQTAHAEAPKAEPAPDPEPAIEAEPEIEMDPVKVGRAKKPDTSHPDAKQDPKPEAKPTPRVPIAPPQTRELAREAYSAALRIEPSDPKLAAANYRAIARGKDPGYAGTALIALVELSLKQNDAAGALGALEEHHSLWKPARSPIREDALWFRIEALKAMGKRDEARGAASDYLREFPEGAFAKPAARLTK